MSPKHFLRWEIESIMELLGREFSAMVKRWYASQPCTNSLATKNSMASIRRQGSDYLIEQVIVA